MQRAVPLKSRKKKIGHGLLRDIFQPEFVEASSVKRLAPLHQLANLNRSLSTDLFSKSRRRPRTSGRMPETAKLLVRWCPARQQDAQKPRPLFSVCKACAP